MSEPVPEQYPVYIQPSSEMPQQNTDQLSEECDKILSIIDQLTDECNNLFNNTISVNASIRIKIENNVITLYIDVTFLSNVSTNTTSELCQYFQGKLQPVSSMNFQNCILPAGTRYSPGNTVTMQLQSDPMNSAPTGSGTTGSGASGLVSSILVIGFSTYLLQFI